MTKILKSIIEPILQRSVFSNIKNTKLDTLINEICWKTQESTSQSILFYKLNDNSEQSLELLKERLLKASYGVIVTNLFDDEIKAIENVIIVKNDEWLETQKIVLDFLYPLPNSVKIVGITGTNGKTTTVDILSQLATRCNVPNITIGTLGLRKGNEILENFGLTTPSYIDLRKYLYKYSSEANLFFVEVSSHALEQKRFYGLSFEVSGWTSFSQDHLDYHKTMDSYFEAKKLIIAMTKNNKVFISPKSKELLNRVDTFTTSKPIQFKVKNSFFKAGHNLINLEVALGILNYLGIIPNQENINNIQPPPGRFEILEYANSFVVIDFAHTPDALENICSSIKKSFPDYELVTLFGCGGNRDKSKRPLMGKVAQSFSDKVIVTSDNPRYERPEDIINDILHGITLETVKVIVDREHAIKFAMKHLNKSVLLIAGKGHENYMDVSGSKIPYSDEKVVKDTISNDKV